MAGRASTPRASTVAVESLTAGDIRAWRALARRAAEPNPFFEADLVLAAVRHLGGADVKLAWVSDGDEWLACMPLRAERAGRVLPVARAWGHQHTFLATPLVDAARTGPAAAALLAELSAASASGAVLIQLLGDGGPVAAALRAAWAEQGLTPLLEVTHERAALERRAGGDYLAAMRSHRRRELNRLGRRLAAHLGGELEVTDRAGDPGAVERFLELEASGWKARNGTALASAPGEAEYFRAICATLAADNRLQLLALGTPERTVAMKCNFIAGDSAFCFKIGHDAALAEFSPGVQLERENVRIFHDRRELRQDSCADPANQMINRLWPDRRRVTNVLLARAGIRSALARPLIAAAQRRRANARAAPSR